jgi:hypothetical protein
MDTAGTKDSTTLELRADMKAPTATEPGAETNRRAEERPAVTDFTAAPLNVGLQSRTPKPARIPVLLVGTTTVAPHATTPTGVSRACTAVAFTKPVACMAEASTVDCILRITRYLPAGRNNHE